MSKAGVDPVYSGKRIDDTDPKCTVLCTSVGVVFVFLWTDDAPAADGTGKSCDCSKSAEYAGLCTGWGERMLL